VCSAGSRLHAFKKVSFAIDYPLVSNHALRYIHTREALFGGFLINL
jgi:hypothetical protein